MTTPKDFYWDQRITADADTVDAHLFAQTIIPQAANSYDLITAAEWLSTYGAENADDPVAQSMANVIAFLLRKADQQTHRANLAAAKREYAAAHGIPVSAVRVKR